MNPNEQIPVPEESLEALDVDQGPSVDDFIRQLEERERDLHITSDLSIEIANSDVNMSPAQSFVETDVSAAAQQFGDVEPKDLKAAISSGTRSRSHDLENEIAQLKLRVMELKNERAEQQEKNDRRLKDFENYKYRMDRERRGSFIDQITNLATQMLPALDNLNRAIDSVPAHAEEKDPAFGHFFDGIVLVSQQVNEIFAGMGVEPIKAKGELFDPAFHEAVAVEESTEIPANTIVQEMLCGYRIGNRVIRHSMVKVTTGGPKASAAAAPATEQVETPSSELPSQED